ncbi:MAG TPA: DUF3794 domain-containing protein [Bacillota bacterium]|nr:DUF3794 domain-containing protein [Bacillota bacterium]HPT88118.1 DUF3794 domain-containing protein [Bacillota bacterium]
MNISYSPIQSPKDLQIETETVKSLKVVGETVGQLVLANKTCINAIKIDRIKAHILKSTDRVFKDKIIKDGIIRKEIFYVNPDNILRFLSEDVPFTLNVDIPGLSPGPFTHVQNHVLDIKIDHHLKPARQCFPGCLEQIIVAHIHFVAAEWCQLELVTSVR